MNVGETDADGWTYVRFGDAAKAAQDGTHECETKHVNAYEWNICYSFSLNQHLLYRIREKARTITVTIPRPYDSYGVGDAIARITYHPDSNDDITAINAIRAAMEKQS